LEPLEQRKQELLDGKRVWTVTDAGGDYEVFLSEFVEPLCQLRYEGFFL
jgi:hypothetical protein